MKRSPAAHRLATRHARAERAYRRSLYRYPVRWVTGVSEEDLEGLGERMRNLFDQGQIWHIPDPVITAGSLPAEYRRHVDAAHRMPSTAELIRRSKRARGGWVKPQPITGVRQGRCLTCGRDDGNHIVGGSYPQLPHDWVVELDHPPTEEA